MEDTAGYIPLQEEVVPVVEHTTLVVAQTTPAVEHIAPMVEPNPVRPSKKAHADRPDPC